MLYIHVKLYIYYVTYIIRYLPINTLHRKNLTAKWTIVKNSSAAQIFVNLYPRFDRQQPVGRAIIEYATKIDTEWATHSRSTLSTLTLMRPSLCTIIYCPCVRPTTDNNITYSCINEQTECNPSLFDHPKYVEHLTEYC